MSDDIVLLPSLLKLLLGIIFILLHYPTRYRYLQGANVVKTGSYNIHTDLNKFNRIQKEFQPSSDLSKHKPREPWTYTYLAEIQNSPDT